jgi:hypothetical protein
MLGSSAKSELLAFLDQAVPQCLAASAVLRFDYQDEQHRNTLFLYGTILELTDSAVALMKAGAPAGLPMLLRSVLEATVDLRNQIDDQKYIHVLYAMYLEKYIWFLEEALTLKNPFLKSLGEHKEVPKTLTAMKEQLAALKRQGYEPLSVYRRFKKAGMEHEYSSVYNSLCSDAHNNLRSLQSRHRDDVDSGGIGFFREDHPADWGSNRIAFIDLLTSCSVKVHDFFKSPKLDEVKTVEGRWKAKQQELQLSE